MEKWKTPGWTWELELLALVFVLASLFVPMHLYYSTAEPEQEIVTSRFDLAIKSAHNVETQANTVEESMGIIWGIIILGAYVAHLAFTAISNNFLSVSFTSLLAPGTFASIAYYRITEIQKATEANILSGTMAEAVLWIVGVIAITLLAAYRHKLHYLKKFSSETWLMTTRSRYDSTFLTQMMFAIRPLIYPPRKLYVSEKGVLIVGVFYVMPIPIEQIQAVDRVKEFSQMLAGYTLATSARELVRIHLKTDHHPLLLSPVDSDEFIMTCRENMVHLPKPNSQGTARSSQQTG